MPDIRFDFYQVTGDDNISLLETLSQMTHKSPEECFYNLGKDKCIISKKINIKKRIAVLFTRIRMDQLPVKTKLSGERNNILLDEDEGLGEDVAFGYDPDLKIIAVQRNIHSISCPFLLEWLRRESENPNLDFKTIIKTGALDRFENMSALRRVEIKVARPNNLDFLSDKKNMSELAKLNLQKMLLAPYVSVVFSCGRQKGESLNPLIPAIKQLLKTQKDQPDFLRNAEVTGLDNDQLLTIDLLEDKLVSKENVKKEGRSIEADDLLAASIRAIRNNLEELKNYAP